MFLNSILRDCCCLGRRSKNNYQMNPPESLIALDSGHIGRFNMSYRSLIKKKKNIFFLHPILGQEVVILKNGKRVCGSGGAVLNQSLLQSKSYFEIKIQQSGHWSIGLCTLNTDLNKTRGGLDKYSWCLNAENLVMNDGKVIHDLNEIYSSTNGNMQVNEETEELLPSANKTELKNTLPSNRRSLLPQESDIIGVTYDHVELNFYLNGKNLNVPVLIRVGNQQQSQQLTNEYNNEIYPCLFVDDGAILDLIVDNFNFQIPSGYDKIMVEQTLL